jgi:hypothetical protein
MSKKSSSGVLILSLLKDTSVTFRNIPGKIVSKCPLNNNELGWYEEEDIKGINGEVYVLKLKLKTVYIQYLSRVNGLQ